MRQEKQEFLKKMKKEISEIKKEGKIEDIKIEPVKEKKSKKYSLKKGALIGATALALATTNVPIRTTNDGSKTLIEAEAAKKDKKKPVLTFKGKTKMVVQENESIKIPKTTAKDNKDGNVTKKIKVTVKKGKKNYAGIAKKIKNNKPVTFTDTGKYVITYTVSDKAGNKATKKRYITVTEGLTTTETVTTEAPVTRRTPARVQQTQTTEAPTTSAPATTEAPTTEAKAVDLSEYANIEKVTVNGITYNVTDSLKKEMLPPEDGTVYNVFLSNYNKDSYVTSIVLGIGNNSKYKNIDSTKLLLTFMGKVSVDINFVDYSENLIFYKKYNEENNWFDLFVLAAQPNGNLISVFNGRIAYGEYTNVKSYMNFYTDPYFSRISCDDSNEFAAVPTPINLNTKVDDDVISLKYTIN